MLLTFKPHLSKAAFGEILGQQGMLAEYTGSRREDLLKRFYVRFPGDVRDWKALQPLLERGTPQGQALALYYHTARTETLLGDFVREFLFAAWLAGRLDLPTTEVAAWVRHVTAARGQGWSDSLCTRAAQGLMSITRDAGLLEGVQRKRLRYPYLPDEMTLYVLLTLRVQGFTTGQRVVTHPDWRLFLLTEADVGAHLAWLAEQGVIEWSATGSVYHLQIGLDDSVQASEAVMRAVL